MIDFGEFIDFVSLCVLMLDGEEDLLVFWYGCWR